MGSEISTLCCCLCCCCPDEKQELGVVNQRGIGDNQPNEKSSLLQKSPNLTISNVDEEENPSLKKFSMQSAVPISPRTKTVAETTTYDPNTLPLNLLEKNKVTKFLIAIESNRMLFYLPKLFISHQLDDIGAFVGFI